MKPLEVSAQLVMRGFQSPFDELGPEPLAWRAALMLQQSLSIDDQREGKTFGVLVVRDSRGQAGYLQAFSGMWAGQWLVEGFSAPMFEVPQRLALDAASDAQVTPLRQRVEALEHSPQLLAARQRVDALVLAQRDETAGLAARHRINRAQRAQGRRDAASNLAADRLSREDTADARALKASQREALANAEAALNELEQRVTEAKRELSSASAHHVKQIIELPQVINAKGETTPLAALYTGEVPGGAGECAAPKLINQALRHALTPLSLAEFWWGPAQASGRLRGVYMPACKTKCGPLLPFMLQGLEVVPPRRVKTRLSKEALLKIIFEDEHLRVIEKPEGLLSVRGREASHADSVETRMPDARVVHRLDLDTSGVLVLAKSDAVYVALQRQFQQREIEKRYAALVEGLVAPQQGVIELSLRADVDDRPRQIVDAVHGKPAATRFEVRSRDGSRTRLALFPLTGRTHQLRMHCASALGLGCPITGDRLYGTPSERLMLHCERLALIHPVSAAALVFESPAPF